MSIQRRVRVGCDYPGCRHGWEVATHDARVARADARLHGWVIGRALGKGPQGSFTEWCPKHAGAYLLKRKEA